MVLAEPIGRPRSFWAGFGLAFATVGVYGFFWDVRAHQELYHQFDLARERRPSGMEWYGLGAAIVVTRMIYYHIFASNVQYLCRRMRMPGPSPGLITTLMATATGILYGSVLAALLYLDAYFVVHEEISAAAELTAYLIIIGGIITWAVLKATAYASLQRHVNALWQAHRARVAGSAAARPAPPTVAGVVPRPPPRP